MKKTEKKARKEFFDWFIKYVSPVDTYDDNNVDHNTLLQIEGKMKELMLKYNLSSETVFESVLYDLQKGYN